MPIFTDILIFSSATAFLVGFISLFLKRIRINQKSRIYFLLAVVLFGLALTLGWNEFVEAFNRCAAK